MLYTYYKQYGNVILFSYIQNGITHHKRIKTYKPSLYTISNDETNYKSIYGYNLKRKEFKSIKQAKEYAEVHKSLENFVLEGNSNYANQFVIEMYEGKPLSFNSDEIRGCVLDVEVTAPVFPKPEDALFEIDAITLYDTVEQEYTVFGLGDYDHSLDNTDAKNLKVYYYKMASEEDLLKAILNYFNSRQFHYTSGWNSETFDIPYIINRMTKVLGEDSIKQLSPYKIVNTREIRDDYDNINLKIDIYGLPHLDYMQLYKKHIFTPRESYSLGFIASEELGDTKLSYEEEGTLANLSKNNWQKYISYNIKDVDIIVRLDNKLGLFSLTHTLAYYCLSNYEDTLGTVKIWEQLIAKDFYNKGMVPLFNRRDVEFRKFPGGFVSRPIVGKHSWVSSFDLNSLYPHLEMQINISPETHVPREQLPDELKELQDKLAVKNVKKYYEQVMTLVNEDIDTSILKKYNYSMSACGQFYRRDKKGAIAQIKEDVYNNRKQYKKLMLKAEQELENIKEEMKVKGSDDHIIKIKKEKEREISINDNLQMALKILLNSGYGALGNKSFLYFKIENAESITTTGQLVNRYSSERINTLINKMTGSNKRVVCANDTDSKYLILSDIVKAICPNETDLDKITDKVNEFCNDVLSPEIEKNMNRLADYLNSYENKMIWEREVISPSAIFVAKKRYAMLVKDSEGVRYKNPKDKVIGLESKKSSTPQWSREALNKCYIIALEDDDESRLHNFVEDFRKKFDEMDINNISTPTGVNGIEKYTDKQTNRYIKGTPKNVKAAINHNRICKENGWTHINPLQSGSKIKYFELKMPNPIEEEVIGFESFLPKEFGLEKYVNKDLIFEKNFLQPLQNFLDAIEWKHEPVLTLDSFF